VIAIPNASDRPTVAALKKLQSEFAFLELLEVPATDDPSWQPVWDAWNANPKAYWWHHGANAHDRNLPPKKTRQLVYAFYTLMESNPEEGTLVSYTDADSCPPKDHFLAAAIGIRKYGALQSKNVAGNAGLTWASSFCAFDHMSWDGGKYEHLSGDPRQPYWMLGKGLFFRARDIYDLGSFHPWLTIEDPEIGLRLWKNGIKLGVIEGSLIEEVPTTFANAITQRKRWVAGFFQTLKFRGGPMDLMDFSFIEKTKAWLIFLPCALLAFNWLGLTMSVWGRRRLVHWNRSSPGMVLLLGGDQCLAMRLLGYRLVLSDVGAHQTDHGRALAAGAVHAARQSVVHAVVVDFLGHSPGHRLPHVSQEPRPGVGAHAEE
jgi:hypothetical protein